MAALYNKAVKILKENECYFIKQAKGSHEIWYSPITNKNVTIVKSTKSRHTINEIFKQAGINEKL